MGDDSDFEDEGSDIIRRSSRRVAGLRSKKLQKSLHTTKSRSRARHSPLLSSKEQVFIISDSDDDNTATEDTLYKEYSPDPAYNILDVKIKTSKCGGSSKQIEIDGENDNPCLFAPESAEDIIPELSAEEDVVSPSETDADKTERVEEAVSCEETKEELDDFQLSFPATPESTVPVCESLLASDSAEGGSASPGEGINDVDCAGKGDNDCQLQDSMVDSDNSLDKRFIITPLREQNEEGIDEDPAKEADDKVDTKSSIAPSPEQTIEAEEAPEPLAGNDSDSFEPSMLDIHPHSSDALGNSDDEQQGLSPSVCRDMDIESAGLVKALQSKVVTAKGDVIEPENYQNLAPDSCNVDASDPPISDDLSSQLDEERNSSNEDPPAGDLVDASEMDGIVQVLPSTSVDGSVSDASAPDKSTSETESNSAVLPEVVACTACGKKHNPLKRQFCQHPVLNVIVCKGCNQFYNSSRFRRDSYGIEEFCKWCADGGALVCCDYCEKAFCRSCIKRNLGKAFLKVLTHADDDVKWKCFVCDVSQISEFQDECRSIMNIVGKLRQSETPFEKRKVHLHGPSQSQRLKRLAKANEAISRDGELNSAISDSAGSNDEAQSDEVPSGLPVTELPGKSKRSSKRDSSDEDTDDIFNNLNNVKLTKTKSSARLSNLALKLRKSAAVAVKDEQATPKTRTRRNVDKSVSKDLGLHEELDISSGRLKQEPRSDSDTHISDTGNVYFSDVEMKSDENFEVNESKSETDENGKSDNKSDSEVAEAATVASSSKRKTREKRKAREDKSSASRNKTTRKKQRVKCSDSGSSSESSAESSDDHVRSKSIKYNRRRRKRMMDTESSLGSSEQEDITPKKKKKKRQSAKKSKKAVVKDSGSEDSSSQDKDTPSKSAKRKNIRRILKDEELTEESKRARQLEEERRQRLLEKTNAVLNESAEELKSVDNEDAFYLEKNDDVSVTIHPAITKQLKPHQKEGIQFLYDSTIESVKKWKDKDEGGGAMLAHCMGLGKTLQVVSLVHTLMTNEHINMKTVLVVAPLNTVYNWQAEFEKWLPVDDRLDVSVLTDAKGNMWSRADMISEWYEYGGILIIGYTMYRNLSSLSRVKGKRQKKIMKECLVDPGPDMCVCDEGHVLKNNKTALSVALNNIRTKRRIVLTGTPLQNNLMEYHVMVDFIKPKLLGTHNEFQNRFINPIHNGQCSDSTPSDVRVMKQRCHILYQLLSGCVQRKDYSVLKPFLTPKHEYTVFIRLSPKQIELYELYLEKFVYHELSSSRPTGTGGLFANYQTLMRIWSHPWGLRIAQLRRLEREKYDSLDEFIDDEVYGDDSSSASKDNSSENEDHKSEQWNSEVDSEDNSRRSAAKGRKKSKSNVVSIVSSDESDASDEENTADHSTAGLQRKTRGTVAAARVSRSKERTKSNGNDQEDGAGPSGVTMAGGSTRSGTAFKDATWEDTEVKEKAWFDDVLKEEDEDDIMLSGKMVFLLEILADAEVVGDKVLVFSQSLVSLDIMEKALGGGRIGGDRVNWCKGCDYFRMDGSTNAQLRQRWTDTFNDPDNPTARLFLISTRAGSLGVNMVAANRVVIFDCSWNPSHDVQSIFRVYRFGQLKPCYIYRLIAEGTMEEKIYDRQIRKLAMAGRVVDEMQISRHFTDEEIRELYSFTAKPYVEGMTSQTPQLPKDPVLAEVLQRQHPQLIVRYHEHELLLENVEEEKLTEEERGQAWSSYQAEKERAANPLARFPAAMDPSLQQENGTETEEVVSAGLRQQMAYEHALLRQHLEDDRRARQNTHPSYLAHGAAGTPLGYQGTFPHGRFMPPSARLGIHGSDVGYVPVRSTYSNAEDAYRMLQISQLANQRFISAPPSAMHNGLSWPASHRYQDQHTMPRGSPLNRPRAPVFQRAYQAPR